MPVRLHIDNSGHRTPPGARFVVQPCIFGNLWIVSKTPGDPGRFRFYGGTVIRFPYALTAEEAAARYRAWILGGGTLWQKDLHLDAAGVEIMRKRGRYVAELARKELAGVDLACYCRPGTPCHADTLLEVAN